MPRLVLGEIAQSMEVLALTMARFSRHIYTQESFKSKSRAVTRVFEAACLLTSVLVLLLSRRSSSHVELEHWLRLLFRRNVIVELANLG